MTGPSVTGGVRHGVSHSAAAVRHTPTAAERQAAIAALSKLTHASPTKGVASVFGGSLKSATLSGGSIHREGIRAGSTHLVTGRGSDTFAGGVKSGAKPVIHSIGSDTVISGSAFKKVELASQTGKTMLGETIKVTGATAAGVKTPAEHSGHSITMADQTHITLTGVTPHNIKPH